jgi:DHA1 family bicyclomycin/chloramphenicol resistance-like MFS transporter
MILFVCLLLEILSGCEVDLFVPGFPNIQDYFLINSFQVELILAVNLIAYCIASLFVGALGDRFGRRPIILGGLVLFILGSLLCVIAENFGTLLFGRVLQGLGIASPAVLSYVVIADHFSFQEQKRLMGYLNGITTLAMAIAPVIGSYINYYFQWRGNFFLLFILGIFCLMLAYFFIPASSKNKNVRLSLSEYKLLFKCPRMVLYLMILTFLVQGYWIFVGFSPILYMKEWNVSLLEFGYYQGAIAAAFSVLSLGSSWITKVLGEKRGLLWSFQGIALFLILFFYLIVTGTQSPIWVTISMMILSASYVYPTNILWVEALEEIPEAKGRISALFVASRLILTSLALQGIGYFYKGDLASMGIPMFIFTVLGFCGALVLYREKKKSMEEFA